ncbi:hypothetical protein HORIV_19710 [Vreelandella olivaria]|uniref:Uncharacterized protein n=1 Tax=Vreelandella olivaria TaxID=390919 RepID=A0ABN5WX39_9GAMM|nr:hypothetical protein HORIV_19710 [Halomonas olivaria]
MLENAAASQGIEVSVVSRLFEGVVSDALLSEVLLASLLESGTEKAGSRRSRPLGLLPTGSAAGFVSAGAASGATGDVASDSGIWGLGVDFLAALAAAR